VNNKHLVSAFKILAFYILFQVAVGAGDLLGPAGELSGLSVAEKLNWLASWFTRWTAYANPPSVFFVYLAAIKWLLIDRQVRMGWLSSAAYYSPFGFYCGALFMNNWNGRLHHDFDQALGIDPQPALSAIFPLSLAFVVPFAVTLLISIVYRGRRKARPVAN
jgi:hypothetical protein